MRAATLHALVLMALLVGLGLSTFAAYESTHPAAAAICSPNQTVSCAKVDASGQTTLLGVPDWAVGVGGFLLMIALDLPLYRSWRRDLLYALTGVSLAGLAVSVYLGYVEAVRIGALCPVCLSAYLANVLALVALLALVRAGRDERTATAASSAGAAAGDGDG